MKKLVFLLLATFSLSVVAQEEIKEGVITSKMTMSSPNEEMKAQLAMMGDMITTTYFKDAKSRSEINNPMSGETITITDSEAKKTLTMMSNPMLGKKYAIQDIDVSEEDLSGVDITKGDETKTVLGYVCDQYNVKMSQQGVDMTMTIYSTEKISAASQQTANLGDFKGFPMYMTVNIQQGGMDMVMTYEVTEIKKESITDDKFDMTPPEGYEKMEN